MTEEVAQEGQAEQGFQIQRIYLRDVSFESPLTPELFRGEWTPEQNFHFNIKPEKLSEDVYNVSLEITVTAKHEDKTAFLIEIEQAGIFTISGFEEGQLDHMLRSYCPNILFPYAREIISDMTVKGGFPPLLLAPVNFDAVYAQHLADQGKDENAGQTVH